MLSFRLSQVVWSMLWIDMYDVYNDKSTLFKQDQLIRVGPRSLINRHECLPDTNVYLSFPRSSQQQAMLLTFARATKKVGNLAVCQLGTRDLLPKFDQCELRHRWRACYRTWEFRSLSSGTWDLLLNLIDANSAIAGRLVVEPEKTEKWSQSKLQFQTRNMFFQEKQMHNPANFPWGGTSWSIATDILLKPSGHFHLILFVPQEEYKDDSNCFSLLLHHSIIIWKVAYRYHNI